MDSDETLFDDSQVCNREHYTISYSDTDYCLKEEEKKTKKWYKGETLSFVLG